MSDLALCPGQGSRSGSPGGVEVERGAVVVAQRIDLHGRDLQKRCKDDLHERSVFIGSLGLLQLHPCREHKACHGTSRGGGDRRGGVEDSCSRCRDLEHVQSPKLDREANSTPFLSAYLFSRRSFFHFVVRRAAADINVSSKKQTDRMSPIAPKHPCSYSGRLANGSHIHQRRTYPSGPQPLRWQ
jgi:hypothetical protein